MRNQAVWKIATVDRHAERERHEDEVVERRQAELPAGEQQRIEPVHEASTSQQESAANVPGISQASQARWPWKTRSRIRGRCTRDYPRSRAVGGASMSAVPVLIGMPRARGCRSRTRSDAAASGPLVDTFGRVHRDLRVSLTDRCSLRCTYCMPEQGNEWLARSSILTVDEIVRVATVAAAAGVTTFRLTGGEPLLRTDIVDVVRRLAAIDGPGRAAGRARDDDERHPPARAAARTDRGGPGPAQHLARHPAPRPVPRPHPPRSARRRARGDRGGRGIRSPPAQAQRGRDARCQRRRARRPRAVRARPRRRAALHRADAARCRAHVGSVAHGDARRDPRHAVDALDADPGARPRGSARRALDARRRSAHGRRHRVGHGAVLRRLRPPAPHRRRPAAQLPLLDDRVRPAADPARRR